MLCAGGTIWLSTAAIAMPTPIVGSGSPLSSHPSIRILVLALAIGAISGGHYATSQSQIIWHEVFQHLYYLPVVLGAYWFGTTGGLVTAVVTSLAYLPHIQMTWMDNYPYVVNQYADILVFHLIGLTVGMLSTSQRQAMARTQQAAGELAAANLELSESFEHVRRADRLSALGEVSAGLAHEIRNPLGSLRGALEILRDRAQPDTPDAEFSELALTELGRLHDLVTTFLSHARPRPPESRSGRLGESIEHIFGLLRPQAKQLGVRLEVSREGSSLELPFDRQQIEQALFNVLLNAIQASPRGGVVTLRETYPDSAGVVEVTDEGPGIPAEYRDRIFDPFFTTKERGTGLGLAITHRIVNDHGGQVAVDSLETGGTRVQIRLPRSGHTANGASTSATRG